ncbi:TPA: hypothetical protein N0F65_007023 [Lagenidium giganteum]|uniref:Uncharacterized protein n=1 Tax=Lagenidium giganteum TaxID=4803 RepID=A0AAV2YYZ6_9STRA|nr:TPA: hypothetical protein N0F65_007023 [Lagenidium giganteum]
MSSVRQAISNKKNENLKSYDTFGDENGDVSALTTGPPLISTGSWWSKTLFAASYPVMQQGKERQLNLEDLWQLERENRSAEAFAKFKRRYLSYNALSSVPPLHRTACTSCQPELDFEDLIKWLAAFFASRLLNAFLTAHAFYHIEVALIRLGVSLKSLLFEKAMRRSMQSKQDKNAVEISNLYSVDFAYEADVYHLSRRADRSPPLFP